jgi:hypothetical protein
LPHFEHPQKKQPKTEIIKEERWKGLCGHAGDQPDYAEPGACLHFIKSLHNISYRTFKIYMIFASAKYKL